MSARSELQKLAEHVDLVLRENNRLRARVTQLERSLKEKPRSLDPGKPTATEEGADAGARSEPQLDRELLKAKVEEMLAELADIG